MASDIVWGAATSAYQIEGAVAEDGRGESIWDRFCARPGAIVDGSSGQIADDHYHRTRDDVALMRELGLQAYRFSIAWPRIQPQGRNPVNQAGLDFYDRLVDRLLESNIQPFATLYHWDLPQTLQDKGGWTNRDIVERFAEYADIVTRRLGDRVRHWITHNEPWVVAYLGHVTGEHAPGLTNPALYPAVVHNLLLSHGAAVPVIRANSRTATPADVGITVNLYHVDPASEHDEDERAAVIEDGLQNRLWLDPLYKGRYPADILERVPIEIDAGEMDRIAVKTDFLGVNYYSRTVVTMGPNETPVHVKPTPAEGYTPAYTAMDWEIYPRGLYALLMRLTRDYNPPAIYITENGAAFDDVVERDGVIADTGRTAYLQAHTEEVLRARADGAPMAGYFAWSLLDNFEWAYGYTKRFGITHVDYATQKRTIKDSGRWYARFIAGEGRDE